MYILLPRSLLLNLAIKLQLRNDIVQESVEMSQTIRKNKSKQLMKIKRNNRFKKNKYSWRIFSDEKYHLHSMSVPKKHIGKVNS
jgi:uncharacterized protein (DUF2461 family)